MERWTDRSLRAQLALVSIDGHVRTSYGKPVECLNGHLRYDDGWLVLHITSSGEHWPADRFGPQETYEDRWIDVAVLDGVTLPSELHQPLYEALYEEIHEV